MADTWVSALGLTWNYGSGTVTLPHTGVIGETGAAPFVRIHQAQMATLLGPGQTIIAVRSQGFMSLSTLAVGEVVRFSWGTNTQNQTAVVGSNPATLLQSAWDGTGDFAFGTTPAVGGSAFTINVTQLDVLVHDSAPAPPPTPPISTNTSMHSNNSFIPMPQSQAVDLKTGYPTIEWYRYWSNPNFQSFSFSGTIGVSNGGTGLTTGNTGGVLYFSNSTTLASSGSLNNHHLVIGGGSTGPFALADTGTTATLLHGNQNGDPTFGPVNLATEVTGVLPPANGGIGVNAANANTVFAGPISGASAAPSFRSLVPADIPNLDASKITTGIFPVARGGTGIASYTIGDLLYASASTTLSSLADVATGNVLRSGGVATAPAWGKVNLTTDVTGILPVANSSWTPNFITGLQLIWNSSTSISVGTGSAVIQSTGLLEVVSSTLTLSSLSLSASTIYHIYLFDTAGSPSIECVTTAPASPYNGRARSKTGDTSRRYVGSIRTMSAGAIVKFAHTPQTGEYFYKTDLNNSNVLAAGTSTSITTVSLSSYLPITSLEAYGTFENTSNQLVKIGSSDTDVAGAILFFMRAVDQVVATRISTDPSQAIQYQMNAAPTSGGLTIWIGGFTFER